MQLSIKLCQIFANEGCVFYCPQHRGREKPGNLIILWQLDFVVKFFGRYNFDNFAEVQYNMVITLS